MIDILSDLIKLNKPLIKLVGVYLPLGLVCSVLTEIITRLMGMKAIFLKKTLQETLDGSKSKGLWHDIAKISWMFCNKNLDLQRQKRGSQRFRTALSDQFFNHPLIQPLGTWPSYIPLWIFPIVSLHLWETAKSAGQPKPSETNYIGIKESYQVVNNRDSQLHMTWDHLTFGRLADGDGRETGNPSFFEAIALLSQEAKGTQNSPNGDASELAKTYIEMWFQDILGNTSSQYKHFVLALIVIVASVLVLIIQYSGSSNYNPLIILELTTSFPLWVETVIGYLLSVFFTCVGAVIAFNYINWMLGFHSSTVQTKQQRLSNQKPANQRASNQ